MELRAYQTAETATPKAKAALCALSTRVNGRVARAVAMAVVVILSLAAVGGQGNPQEGKGGKVQGAVRDTTGTSVAGATVRLERQGAAGMEERQTNENGGFAFSKLEAGEYLVSAAKTGRHSQTTTVSLPKNGGAIQVDLTLSETEAGKDKPSSEPQMEFADKPNFTVAAVTDWTAAGGHGSDANLRTSEALNRQTLTLKPDASRGVAAGPNGESKEAENSLRTALAGAPGNFEANHDLGEFYLDAGRFADAVPLLEAAYRMEPTDSSSEYDLAAALKGNGDLSQARDHVKKMMARKDTADLHRLAGEIDESLNDPLSAVHEFELAAREEPSEQNYFEWGSELLVHRAVLQAKDVYAAGAKAFPNSARMLTALGTALFAGALYDEAAQRLCEASDLNPAAVEPYLFMGKIEMAAPNPLACIETKLARFMNQQPNDPLANYFYAMTLWKQQGPTPNSETLQRVERILTKAVIIDPKCSDAYLQLGNLQATQHDFGKAIGLYTKAIDITPDSTEGHYRLGVAYDRVGEKEKAIREFQLHDEIEKKRAAEVEKQRKEVKQFLVVVNGTQQ